MKKSLILLISISMLCACTPSKDNNRNENTNHTETHDIYEFLIEGNWEGHTDACTNVITFDEDQSFSNWCACGSTVGDADLYETFEYQPSDQSITLSNSYGDSDTGKILYADKYYLIINLWNNIYFYENIHNTHSALQDCALEYVNPNNVTMPCLSILEFKDNFLSVSSHNYDRDAADNFNVWQLPVSQDVVFKNVSVTIENEQELVETNTLTENDYEHIGNFYTYAYLDMNTEGEVTNVIFYGKTLID